MKDQVRCKDCKFWRKSGKDKCLCTKLSKDVKVFPRGTDYCSSGQRRS